MPMHNITHRERVVKALMAKTYDSAVMDMVQALNGHPPQHLSDHTQSQEQRNIAWGFAAVLAGTPDFGKHDVETDCADAVTSILYYAIAAADVNPRELVERAVEYVEQDRSEA